MDLRAVLLIAVTAAAAALPSAQQRGDAAKSAASGPHWKRETSKSEMTDDREVFYSMPAQNTVQGWLSRSRPSLAVGCIERKPRILLLVGAVHSDTIGRVRWDDREAFRDYTWDELTDNSGFATTEPVFTAETMLQAKRLRIEFTPVNAAPVVADFSLAGFDKVYADLTKICDWSGSKPKL